MSGRLEIRTLGGLAVQCAGEPVIKFETRKVGALLVYLACARRAYPREALAELLWEERSQDRALSNLRTALTNLRRQVGTAVITDDPVAMNPDRDFWLDATDFETRLAAGERTVEDLEAALALYQGDFLEGFYVDSQAFEDWALLERERLRLRAMEALDALVAGYLDRREYTRGLTRATQLLRMDSLREETHRQVMRLLALSWQRGKALEQYATCRRLLAEELGVDPTTETTQLYERIRAGELAVPEPARAPVSFPWKPHNLPRQTTPFVGRHQELRDLAHLLTDADVSLVTILGAGGMGKTRLALEAARAHLGRCADGVYFVPLAPLSSADQIVPAIAESVGFQFSGGRDAKTQLLGFLAEKQMLLVLDSFEHLIDAAYLVAEMAQAAPRLTILVTSREKLALSGETIYPLSGLPFPDREELADARAYSAVELFLQSAQRARPDFALQGDDLRHVARLCGLVEGMPLAILLAAAWVNALSVAEIAEEVKQGLDALQAELRDLPAHQRSIRATFDRSWKRLSAMERTVFMRLAVFRGGGAREAVQAVTGARLPALQILVNKSLLRRAPDGRYETHELLRQYAEEQLGAAGQAERAHDAHMDYYLEFLNQREADLKGRRQLAALDEIEADFDNIRAAWQRAVTHRNYDALSPALESALWFCLMRCRFQEGKALFRQACEGLAPQPGEEPHPVWGRALARWAWLASWWVSVSPDVCLEEVSAQAERSLAIARQHGDRAEVAFCLALLGYVVARAADLAGISKDDAMPKILGFLEESLAIYRDLENRFHMARVLLLISYMYGVGVGFPYEEGFRFARQSVDLRRAIGDKVGLAGSLTHLGLVEALRGEGAEAERHWQEALALGHDMGDLAVIVDLTAYLSGYAMAGGDLEAAKAQLEGALQLTRERNLLGNQAMVLIRLATLACLEKDYVRCQQLLKESRPLLPNPTDGGALVDHMLACAACGLGDYRAARRLLLKPLDYYSALDVHRLRDCLHVAAAVVAHEGQPERAVELLGLAAPSVDPNSFCPLPARLRRDLEAALGPEAFAAAWARGQTMNLDAVVAEFLAEGADGEK